MSPHFVYSDELPAPVTDLGELLLPQLRGTDFGPSPTAALQRVLTRAIAAGVSVQHVQRWLPYVATEQQLAILADTREWFRLVSSSRLRVTQLGPDANAGEKAAAVLKIRKQVARLLVARLVTPLPHGGLSSDREVKARTALAIIGAQQLELGYDKIVVSAPWLAARMNLTTPNAHALLKVLEQKLHWIRRAGKRQSGAIRWQLTQIRGEHGEEVRDRSWLHAATIDALSAQEYDATYLAKIISTAGHVAWHYSWAAVPGRVDRNLLGPRAFVALIHQYAGLPKEEGLGLVPRALSKMKRALKAELPGALEGTEDLLLDLDIKADETGAHELFAVHDAKAKVIQAGLKVRQDEYHAALRLRKEERRAVGAILRKAMHVQGDIGPAPFDVDELAKWAGFAAAYFATGEGAGNVLPEQAATAREFLENAIVKRGHDAAKAEKVAAHVFREPAAEAA